MKKQTIKRIFFWCILISLNASCTPITKLFPKEPRPFQSKEFNSEQWKNGDHQMRGEMARDLRKLVTDFKEPWKKSAEEVRQILGKPDQIAETDCCYIGRGVSLEKVEMWLYYIQIEDDYSTNKTERKMISQAFKLYFPNNPANHFRTLIGDKTGDHSLQLPLLGAIKL